MQFGAEADFPTFEACDAQLFEGEKQYPCDINSNARYLTELMTYFPSVSRRE